MGDEELQALRDVLYKALSNDWEISSAGYRRAAHAVLDAGWARAGQATDRAALDRVKALADRAAGYDFDLNPDQIYAAIGGTEEVDHG